METFKYRNQEIQVDYHTVEVKGDQVPDVIIMQVLYQGTDITMILSQTDEQEILETIYDKLYN
jgi:phosphotransferase system HPr-like phosphotransfer protein